MGPSGGEEKGRWKKGPTPEGVEPSVHLYIFREDRVGVGIQM